MASPGWPRPGALARLVPGSKRDFHGSLHGSQHGSQQSRRQRTNLNLCVQSTTRAIPWSVNATADAHFAQGHPPFGMHLHASMYDPISWARVLKEQEYVYHVAAFRMAVRYFVPKGLSCRAIDVGANSGYVSLVAASLSCDVDAFEANPMTAQVARRSFDVNPFGQRITLHNAGIAQTEGSLPFLTKRSGGSIYDKIIGEAEARQKANDPEARVIRIPTRHISAMLRMPSTIAKLNSPITIAKLDCEGCEAAAIETMAPLLLQGSGPRLILAEWITSRIKLVSGISSLKTAIKLLETTQYRCFSWSGDPQPLSTLADIKTEVGDLWLVHPSIPPIAFANRMKEAGGMLETWQALQKCS